MIDRKIEKFDTSVSSNDKQIEDIKNIQIIGEDSYYIYTTVSAIKNIVTTGFDQIVLTVTFTADNQNNAFAELGYQFYVGSVSPANENIYYEFEILRKYSTPDTKVSTWEAKSTYRPAGTYNAIFYVRSFDTGVINVS